MRGKDAHGPAQAPRAPRVDMGRGTGPRPRPAPATPPPAYPGGNPRRRPAPPRRGGGGRDHGRGPARPRVARSPPAGAGPPPPPRVVRVLGGSSSGSGKQQPGMAAVLELLLQEEVAVGAVVRWLRHGPGPGSRSVEVTRGGSSVRPPARSALAPAGPGPPPRHPPLKLPGAVRGILSAPALSPRGSTRGRGEEPVCGRELGPSSV